MNIVTSTLALLCITLIGTVSAADCDNADQTCERYCAADSCPSLNCGQSKTCVQACVATTCNNMMCNAKTNCTQICENCKSKMVCSSPTCEQTCKGDSCEMECTSSVKTCKQICGENSQCELTCDRNTTTCSSTCENANCTGTGLPPKKPTIRPPKTQASSCNPRTGNCTKTCTGECGGTTVQCNGDEFKECHLSCENGCKMECDEKVEKCVMTCIGKKECSRVCKAANCHFVGKFSSDSSRKSCSSAMVCQLNYLMFVLFAFIMISQLKNL